MTIIKTISQYNEARTAGFVAKDHEIEGFAEACMDSNQLSDSLTVAQRHLISLTWARGILAKSSGSPPKLRQSKLQCMILPRQK